MPVRSNKEMGQQQAANNQCSDHSDDDCGAPLVAGETKRSCEAGFLSDRKNDGPLRAVTRLEARVSGLSS
jgi:hypothetical protein